MAVSKSSLDNAMRYKNQGNNEAAINEFKKYLLQSPNDVIAMHNLACTYADNDDYEMAIKSLEEAFSAGLHSTESWLVYARSLQQVGQLDKAISAFKKSLVISPLNLNAHRDLAQLIWMSQGDLDSAIEPLHNYLLEHPDALSHKVLLAELIGQMGDKGQQFTLIQKLYTDSNSAPELAYYISKAALAAGDFEQAFIHGQTAFNYSSTDLKNVLNYINAMLATGKVVQALNLTEQALVHLPLNQHLIALKATAWRLMGNEQYEQLYDYENLVYQSELDVPKGWGSLSDYLNQLETELNTEHKYVQHPFYLSVRHGSQVASINKSKKPAMRAYSEAIEKPLHHFLSTLPSSQGPLHSRNTGKGRVFSAWSVKLPPNGYHVNHVHQEGWISSACHIRPSDNTDSSKYAGWLKLGEPGTPTKPSLAPEKYIEPKAGHVVFFPSYMWHGTEGFSSGSSRLTVAADILPK